MQIFARGREKGSGPVEYIISPLGLVFNEKGKIERTTDGKPLTYDRDPPPVVLRGHPSQTIAVIDSLGFKFKYTSGVLSFAPADGFISEQVEDQIIDDFERVAFAGLSSDQFSSLWVRHVHQGHHELHFVIPRVELTSGKSLNIAPPGYKHYFDPWRSLWNQKHQWAAPDDPARAQLIRQPAYRAKITTSSLKEHIRLATSVEQVITDYLIDLCHAGVLKDRQDVIQALQDADLTVHRQGKNYLSIRADEQSKSTRLKGFFYDESFTAERFFATFADESRNEPAGNRKHDADRIRRLEQDIAAAVERRAQFNRVRYSRAARHPESIGGTDHEPEFATNSCVEDVAEMGLAKSAVNCDELLSRHLYRELGPDAIHGEHNATTISTEANAGSRNQSAISCVRPIASKDLGRHVQRVAPGAVPDPAIERQRRNRLAFERWQASYQDYIKSIRNFYDSVRATTDQHYVAVIGALDAAIQSRSRTNADINSALGVLIKSTRKIEQGLTQPTRRFSSLRPVKNDSRAHAVDKCNLEAKRLLEGLAYREIASDETTKSKDAYEDQAKLMMSELAHWLIK